MQLSAIGKIKPFPVEKVGERNSRRSYGPIVVRFVNVRRAVGVFCRNFDKNTFFVAVYAGTVAVAEFTRIPPVRDGYFYQVILFKFVGNIVFAQVYVF